MMYSISMNWFFIQFLWVPFIEFYLHEDIHLSTIATHRSSYYTALDPPYINNFRSYVTIVLPSREQGPQKL